MKHRLGRNQQVHFLPLAMRAWQRLIRQACGPKFPLGLTFVVYFFWGHASAQIQVVPIESFPQSVAIPAPGGARIQALSLPFFDDFSTVTEHPSSALWQRSNVYINNTLPINHPSINVATFDGLKSDGTPYDVINQIATGPTDTLTSNPIDLSGTTAADAIYLSFYWQRKGLGELPDTEDSLQLQFLNSAGVWEPKWTMKGDTANNNFTQSFVAVTESRFLHAAFQFRFQAFGRTSGAFDTWHIDYIYMNRGRSATNLSIKDIAARQPVSSFLKRYTAMPMKQYLLNPAAETTDTIRTDIVNLFSNFNTTSFNTIITDQLSRQVLQQYTSTEAKLISGFSSQPVGMKPAQLPAGFAAPKAVLQTQFVVQTTDQANIPGVDLRRNDTIAGITVLDNYYAYDDGTAEAAIQNTQRQGRVAMRFLLNKPDAVTGLQVCFAQVKTSLAGQTAVFSIYADERGRPGRTLYQKAAVISYGSSRNGFVEVPFEYGVAVTDTFYVGWTQVSEDYTVAIGFDKNSRFGTQVFEGRGTSWDPNNPGGVPMIRPVLGTGKDAPITGIDDEPEAHTKLMVFPNPNPGILIWQNPALEQIEIADISGRIVLNARPATGQNQLNVSQLADGFYIIRLSDGKKTVVQKLIIRK
ncbi:T9SS type A sorting domain-containing protein [Larkinella rosea]|uniref:T9SS C-terminal target domain-containing protein n=1 Tax=Larkinella rosea TaxID=2025312 RepID=A0A3P1B9H1_9BACT|nr:T9SS type A sorting domain-containing protein [Larkinella rosea]RRA97688.1 T9SS C-terminal target domain-containing protein [Larkinella rosea]